VVVIRTIPHCLAEDPERPWLPERYPKSDATDVPKNAPDAPESQQIPIVLHSGCMAAIQGGRDVAAIYSVAAIFLDLSD
jgi:hypothetical protein